MIWRTADPHRWHKRFAIFPKTIGKHRIWLEWYAVRWVGSERAVIGFVFIHELDHPRLGRFERRDRWIDGGMSYITGDWEPKLLEVA